MKFRSLSSLAAALLASASLTACATAVNTATPTPVPYKACLASSPAGFNDGEISQDAYYGLLQAEAQYGVSTSAVELRPGDSSYQSFRAARKLVARGCNLVVVIGGVDQQLASLANGNPKVQFVEIEPRISAGAKQPLSNSNLVKIAYDTRVAFLQAGYLAASKSATGKVGVIGTAGDSVAQSEIWYFRQGVYQYAEKAGQQIQILGARQADPATWSLLPSDVSLTKLKSRTSQLLAAGADVILPVGVNGLAVSQLAQAQNALVIGSGSDWAGVDRYSSVSGTVLASVPMPFAQVVVDRVAVALGVSSAAPTLSPSVGENLLLTASLTPEGAVSFGGVGGALTQLGKDYLAGKLTVVEPPQVVY